MQMQPFKPKYHPSQGHKLLHKASLNYRKKLGEKCEMVVLLRKGDHMVVRACSIRFSAPVGIGTGEPVSATMISESIHTNNIAVKLGRGGSRDRR